MSSRSDQIVAQIGRLVEEISLGNIEAEAIRPTDRFIQDLGLDSLDVASVLLGCEEWLGIKIEEQGVDWQAIASVEQLAAFLEKQA